MIVFSGRICHRHEVPAGAAVRPFLADVVPIRKGALLVELGQIICAERLATMLGQLGWQCRRKR